jgi:hypothetical protein
MIEHAYPPGGEASFVTLRTAIFPSQSLDVGGMSLCGGPHHRHGV